MATDTRGFLMANGNWKMRFKCGCSCYSSKLPFWNFSWNYLQKVLHNHDKLFYLLKTDYKNYTPTYCLQRNIKTDQNKKKKKKIK